MFETIKNLITITICAIVAVPIEIVVCICIMIFGLIAISGAWASGCLEILMR